MSVALLDAERTRGALPPSTDVLIVGGGIAGAALAYELAGAGVECVLVERGELNREASGTNAGSMHLQIAIHQLAGAFDTGAVADRLREETRFAVEAFGLWADLEAELQGPIDLHLTGGLMVAELPEHVRLLHDKQRIEAEAGLETRVVEGDELRALAPYLSERIAAASYCPAEGHVNPLVAVPLFALRAAERGAVIRTHAPVEGVERLDGPGAARFRVRTGAGTIDCARIVDAAGAWAPVLAAQVGLDLPMKAMGLHVNVTETRARLLEPLIQHIGRRLTLKQAANGSFIIGGGWPSAEAPAPARYTTTWGSAAGNAAVAVDVVPALADVRLIRTWSGVMAWTDDVSPIVGESARVPGFHALVVGSSGYTMTPILARFLAERMASGTALAEVRPEYSPDRAPALRPAATRRDDREAGPEMNRDDVDWKGYWAAVPTPFDEDGSLRLDLLRELLEVYVGMGLHGVLVNGTTGEWFAQSRDERRQVAEAAVEAVAGRIPVLVGCTDYTADLVVDHAAHAIAAGADGYAATPPPYAKPFDEEIVAWYEDLSDGVDAPLMIYNWPHGTSVDMDTALVEELVGIDRVVAYKNSTPDADRFFDSSRAVVDRVRVFGPYMSTRGVRELAEHGGDGTIGGGCLFGAPDPAFWDAVWNGDEAAALAHAQRTEQLFPKLWLPGGWAGQHGHYASELKALMAMLGQPGGTVRRPRLPITDPAKLEAMREILADEGLLARG